MADPIFRLMYGSENRLRDGGAETDAEIGDIMTRSVRNNQAAGITGALLFTGSHFTQVLEGPRAEVERTFERISQDFRHGEVALIDLREISGRAFASWSMTLLDARDRSGADTCRLAGVATPTVEGQSGEAIVELLQRFLAARTRLQPHQPDRPACPG